MDLMDLIRLTALMILIDLKALMILIALLDLMDLIGLIVLIILTDLIGLIALTFLIDLKVTRGFKANPRCDPIKTIISIIFSFLGCRHNLKCIAKNRSTKMVV